MKTTPMAFVLLTIASPAFANHGVSTYETLTEGFLGQSFNLDGVHYRDCNNVAGGFPDGSTFTPADIGNNFIIENSALFFNDFPAWGSPVNTLTFGTAYVNGENLSLGAFATAWMDLDAPSNSVSFDMAYYENGPWGGIVFHLDVYMGEQLTGATSFTIANGGGRDNIAVRSLSMSQTSFDRVHIYATYNGQFSAPRLIIDNLTFYAACGTADFDGDGDSGTDQDIEAFFRCLAGTCCASCYAGGSDFNADGDSGTDADIEAFFRVLAGNPC